MIRATDYADAPHDPRTEYRYVVRGPATPGAAASGCGMYVDIESARRAAERLFGSRSDMRYEDARIETLDGQRVEWAGPSR